jgi:hypothetical protein
MRAQKLPSIAGVRKLIPPFTTGAMVEVGPVASSLSLVGFVSVFVVVVLVFVVVVLVLVLFEVVLGTRVTFLDEASSP